MNNQDRTARRKRNVGKLTLAREDIAAGKGAISTVLRCENFTVAVNRRESNLNEGKLAVKKGGTLLELPGSSLFSGQMFLAQITSISNVPLQKKKPSFTSPLCAPATSAIAIGEMSGSIERNARSGRN